MRQKLVFGGGIVAFVLLLTLVVWQGSFTFGDFGPENREQLYFFWSISSLVFLLMVTLGFMLFRTAVKLYVERRSNKEGSRIKTKLVVGALALSFLPVFFMVLWSVQVLNRNIDKWFSRPAENVRFNLLEIGEALTRDAQDRARAQAFWLASTDEVKQAVTNRQPVLERTTALCRQIGIVSAVLLREDGTRQTLCSPMVGGSSKGVTWTAPVDGGATVTVQSRMPIELETKQHEIQRHIAEYDQLAVNKRETRAFYIAYLLLITLFILFVATWIALFMARQISVPISALLEAAGQVSRGNLTHRVEVTAIDELATLVRAFNDMTRDLETNSRELEHRRRFTETILESIPTGVISFSADGTIQKVNRALRQILPENKVERAARLEDLFTRDDAAEVRYLMKRARRTGVAARQLELKSEGKTLHLSITVAALEEKITSGFVVVLEDTSELLRAQKAAAWHEVARRIAHEIKNPLTPIALCADRIGRQLEKGTQSPDVVRIIRECVQTISLEVESVKTLVDEFSRFARFPAAQPQVSDLNSVVENALAVFSGRLDGIRVETHLSTGLPPVNVDREQFKRVVVNLVDNAAEAMQESLVKVLYVSTQAVGDSVELVVADSGSGVSPEDRERLFLPYFSTKGRGTGLGLAIVNHILSDHKAQIRVEDNAPKGARFIVEIPAAVAAESEVRA